jgi:outer membrane immunogenic protein
MRFFIASALLASAAIATPAFAQDTTAPEGKEFQGIKVLALGGIDDVTNSGSDKAGALFGGTIGYDHQAGKAVFGVEAEVNGSTTKDCLGSTVVAGDTLCAKAGRDLYAGARVGYVLGENTLLYIKGGYTNARVNLTYDDGNTGANNFKVGENLDGWRAGVGFEFNAGKNIVLRTEYRYSNYEQDFTRHQGVIGVGVKF